MLRIISALAVVCAYTPVSASDWEDCNQRIAEYQNAEVTGPSPLMMMLDFAAIIDGPRAATSEGQRVETAYLATMDQLVELSDSIEAFCASLKE